VELPALVVLCQVREKIFGWLGRRWGKLLKSICTEREKGHTHKRVVIFQKNLRVGTVGYVSSGKTKGGRGELLRSEETGKLK